MGKFFTLIIAFVFSSSVSGEEISPDDWKIERRETSASLEQIQQVQVSNLFGEIRVRTHQKNEAYVLINTQRHKADEIAPELEVKQGEGVLTITARFDPFEGEVPAAYSKRRIDMTVFLPKATNAALETRDGLIQARGLSGHLRARSERGAISVRAEGSADLFSRHGDVDIVFLDTRWKQDSKVETLTGPMVISLVSGGAANVSLESNGYFTTDYSMEIEMDPQTRFKRGRVQVGSEGRNLRLKSARGSITLLSSTISQPD